MLNNLLNQFYFTLKKSKIKIDFNNRYSFLEYLKNYTDEE